MRKDWSQNKDWDYYLAETSFGASQERKERCQGKGKGRNEERRDWLVRRRRGNERESGNGDKCEREYKHNGRRRRSGR